MATQMATETSASSGRSRWYPRWTPRLLVAIIALVALALVAVEVVWPLSAGLPVGWGQYQNSAYHLHVGTPAFWSVTADSDLNAGGLYNCQLAVLISPNTEPVTSTRDMEKLPRWMLLSAAFAPCAASDESAPQASLWQPTGQSVVIAGVSAPLESKTVGPPAISYRASVTLHGYTYGFMLYDSTAAQAQRDLPDFLTFARSFRYIS